MGELKKFEMEVNEKIDNAKKETAKLDEKINSIKQGQLTSLQMVLSLQRRVREIEVQLGWAD
jgi:predicted S18 family serine protease